jgi:Protein of unknown function (DUF2827)
MSGASLRIGITIGLRTPNESLWVNGIKQNVLYLAKMLQASPRKHRVTLVNTTDIRIEDGVAWDTKTFPTRSILDMKDDLDVVIELGGQMPDNLVTYLKQRGVKIVSYCCGPEYVQISEAIIFNRHVGSLYINQQYDQLWVIPQNIENSLHFFQTLRRAPAVAVPFVWDPMCIEERMRTTPERELCSLTAAPKRLSIIEPNIDVLKFCLYPILIAEEAFRRNPQLIEYLNVANSDHFVHTDKEFASLMRILDIVRSQKVCFWGRVETPQFLAERTDILISHQWGLPLNYLYLEACWAGYPLVHNAELIPELGFYYRGNDVVAGAQQLLHALHMDQAACDAYRVRQRRAMQRFLATDPILVASYDTLLTNLM